MKGLKSSSKASSSPSERNSKALAILDLAGIASDLSANADNPDFVRAKAEELRQVAEQAYDIRRSSAQTSKSLSLKYRRLNLKLPETAKRSLSQ